MAPDTTEKLALIQFVQDTLTGLGNRSRHDYRCLSEAAKRLGITCWNMTPAVGSVLIPEGSRTFAYSRLITYLRAGKAPDKEVRSIIKELGLRMGLDIYTVQGIISDMKELRPVMAEEECLQ